MTALRGVILGNDNLDRIGAIPRALIIWLDHTIPQFHFRCACEMKAGSDINTLLIHIEENAQVFILIYRRVR